MAENPTFSGFSNGDAADTFSKVIAQIRSDMAAIEASAKNIEKSLSKSSRHSFGGSSFGASNSGGNTGSASPTDMSSSLGEISGSVGGKARTAMFGIGGIAGAVGGAGFLPGGIALAGLPDLIDRPEAALNKEAARFGMAQATGDFGTFQNMLNVAKNDFNVQNQQAFMNTMVFGTQRMGLVGMLGGGRVGETRAASQIGGYNTLAALAGIDQSQVPGMMASMNGAQAYYASMAAGVMTRNPVTGEPIGIEGQVNQLWRSAGIQGMSQEDALAQIDINYGIGSMGRLQLEQMYGGDQAAVESVIEGLRIRARQGGKPLTENQVQDQMKAIGAEGGLGTEKTQGMEATRRLEGERLEMGAKYLDDATAGIEEAANLIADAVETLTELQGPLETMLRGYITLANQMDVFQTEVPGLTKGLTDFFGGLPSLLMSYLLGRFGLRAGAGLLGKALPKMIPGGGAAVAGATAVAGTGALFVAGGWNTAQKASQGYDMDTGTYDKDASRSEPLAKTIWNWLRGEGWDRGWTKGEGKSKGDWFVEADQDGRIHYGEMVLPARVADAVREELALGKTSPTASSRRGDGTTVNIYLTVQKASDSEAIYFANRVKRILDSDEELLAIGTGRFGV